MTLIRTARHTAPDLEQWEVDERTDALFAARWDWDARISAALDEMQTFASEGPCYAGVSWGKDSLVIADLVRKLRERRNVEVPLVWVHRVPIDNPECPLVQKRFADLSGMSVHEERVECVRDAHHPENWWAADVPERNARSRPKQVGFARVASRFGDRFISGVRAAESGARTLRMRRFGVSTGRTCAPIGWWPTAAVFAYLLREDLPVHPAYGYTSGGLYARDRIRVGSIGGPHGRGHGRAEWERRYYPEVWKETVAAPFAARDSCTMHARDPSS